MKGWGVRIGAAAAGAVTLAAAFTASAATNTVPPTNIGVTDVPLTIAQLAPPECAGLALTTVVYSGTGGGGNDLVLGGGSTPSTLSGRGGDDCIVGGANNATLRGQGGNDVLIGGPRPSVNLQGGPGNDTCYRGLATTAFPTGCETYVP
ncbi:MAG: hypothetical protein KatS3mg063_1426 [Tepidiforma sp.]|uniref:hypothetical protein n=1 Tax=Tepidiforma sp. TaxID=2682230 RepID=UPI0021DDC6F7|nr:hypothetical protein [Tepidiforma sp.]GIW15573.1 MAG: hypothetical protein KatS3mg063_1426 [Tepidiforma sp.]